MHTSHVSTQQVQTVVDKQDHSTDDISMRCLTLQKIWHRSTAIVF